MLRPVRLALSPLLAVAALAATATGRAGAGVSIPAPGLVHRSETRDGRRWHLVTVELGKPGLAVHVSREASKGRTLSQIALAEGATVAINANIFRDGFSLCGVAFSRGEAWREIDASSCVHGFGWGRAPSTFQLVSTKALDGLPAGMTDLVSGYPTLVRGGVPCDGRAPEVCAIPAAAPSSFVGPNPRTLLGVDKDRKRMFFVVADGRELGAAAGLSLLEASVFLRDTVGAWDAVNLDGGGSSELWIASEGGVVNVPSDGAERPIASAIVVRFDPTQSASAPTALPAEPPAVDAPASRDRGRSAAAAPTFVFFVVAGVGLWLWSRNRDG